MSTVWIALRTRSCRDCVMRDLAVLFIHLIATVARLPGGQLNVVNPFQQDNHAREQNDQLLNNSHFFGQTGLRCLGS